MFWFNNPLHTSLVCTSPPAVEPVSLDQAKANARVEIDDDDALITALITAARIYCESYTKRVFITSSWTFALDAFPFYRQWALLGSPIILPIPPLQSVSEIQFLDSAGNVQTMDTDLYVVDTASQPGRIALPLGLTWPSTGWLPGAVSISMTCGFGDSGSDVPQTINQAILLLVAHYYQQREACSDVSLVEVPMAVKALLDASSPGIYV